jgi:uncharacterized membrane protein YoaK (UPF0700 family)
MENHRPKKVKFDINNNLTPVEKRKLERLEKMKETPLWGYIVLLILFVIFAVLGILITIVGGGAGVGKEFLWIAAFFAVTLATIYARDEIIKLYKIMKKLLQSNQPANRSENNR